MFAGFAISIPQHFVYRIELLANISCFHHGAGCLLRRDAYLKREPLSRNNLTEKETHGITDAQAARAQDFSCTHLQILINAATHISGFQQYTHKNALTVIL
ncbi:hypothetical protein EMIT0P294_160002 [Pseudomonas sp. IT-P294]